jgi:hypothetical protein
MVRNISWRPVEVRDPLGDALTAFDTSFKQGREARYEKDAPDAFAKYLDSLGGQQQPAPAQMPGTGAATDALVNGSHSAVASAQDPALTDYFAKVRTAESGGNDAAKNPNSTATGRYQFLESTWADVAKRHPELGLTPDGRTDAAQQERAMRVLTQENAKILGTNGIKPNPGALYAAHFLGAGGASKVLTGDPNSPVSAYVDPNVIAANPQLANMTVGQFAQWANEKGGNGAGGYAPPASGQPQQVAQQQGTGLPPREVMLELFRNPNTRPLAIELAKSATEGRAPKPIEINGQLVDPSTGKVIGDYRDPQQPQPLTDVAKLKSDLDAGMITQDQYNAAVAKELAASNGTSLTVDPTTGAVSFQQGGSPGQMPKLTEGQSKDVVYLTRGAGALPILDQLGDALTDPVQQVMGADPTGVVRGQQDPAFQQAEQAGREFLASVLRKDTGAAVTPSEMDTYGNMYLPKPGDTPELLAQKKGARQRALKAIELGIPSAAIVEMENRGALPGRGSDAPAGEAPAGFPDPSLWEFLTPQERALWQK